MASISLENCDLKGVYKFLIADVLRDQDPPDQNDDSDVPLTPLKCETLSQTTDWNRTWRLVRAKGLGPELTSFMLKILWGIVPTRARLCGILPLIQQNPSCQLCSTPETSHPESLDHALLSCPANADLPTRLLAALQKRQPGASLNSILTLDLEVDKSMELPLVWTIGSILFSIWTQREKGRVDRIRTKAQVEAKCRGLKDSKSKLWEQAHPATTTLLAEIFNV